jgi:hypothetical protein
MAGRDHPRLVEERVALDLVADQGFGHDPHRLFDERDREVGNADMARKPVLLDLAQRAKRFRKRDLRIGPVQ